MARFAVYTLTCMAFVAFSYAYPDSPSPECSPSPCGPNSKCGELNGYPLCRCEEGFIGAPPECRPESSSSSDSQSTACSPSPCGPNSKCREVSDQAVCSCDVDFIGSPPNCRRPESSSSDSPSTACSPSPCGPNSKCREVHEQAVCSCEAGSVGSPPNCRSDCLFNRECDVDKACINKKCRDPCLGTCGNNSECRVSKHLPGCSCPVGWSGDPYVECFKKVT